MARRRPTLVYVHGAGAQPPEADWIRIHNQILFSERPAPVTDVAYYADLIQRFDDPGAAPSSTEAKSKPIVHDARADLAVSDAALAEASAAQQVLSDSIHGSVAGEGYGQLGNGVFDKPFDPSPFPVPVKVSGLRGALRAISAGISSVCGVTDVGGLKCWALRPATSHRPPARCRSTSPASTMALSPCRSAVQPAC